MTRSATCREPLVASSPPGPGTVAQSDWGTRLRGRAQRRICTDQLAAPYPDARYRNVAARSASTRPPHLRNAAGQASPFSFPTELTVGPELQALAVRWQLGRRSGPSAVEGAASFPAVDERHSVDCARMVERHIPVVCVVSRTGVPARPEGEAPSSVVCHHACQSR